MISLADARALVLARCPALPAAPIDLDAAAGCVLAVDAVAVEPVPPFANSAMDGFAVRAADVAGASPDRAVRLRVTATIAAGAAGEDPVGPGEAARIMTGAPMPPGADAVVQVEHTAGGPEAVEVEIFEAVAAGRHIRAAGDDVAAGDLVIPAGTVLRPAHLGVLASLGLRRPSVIRRPRVGVLSTGDELVSEDRPLRHGEIRESNRPTLVAFARSAGVDAVDLGTVPDDAAALRRALEQAAASCDAIITSGGVSMGDFDVVKEVLGELADMSWLQVAIRPAKPFAFGVLEGTPVFGLPGNPVSSVVSLSLLGVPGLRQLAGRSDLDLPWVPAVAGVDLRRKPDGRDAYLRVRLRWELGRLVAEPVQGQGSHHLAAAAGADGLAHVPDGDGIVAGGEVAVLLWDLPPS